MKCRSFAQCTITENDIKKKKYRLADFINAHWEDYVKSPKTRILPEQFKAINAIRVCRTAALGIDVYACPECGEIKEIYHSCKHRFCPTCSYQDTVEWANRIHQKLLAVPHRHITCTLPHELIPLIKLNRRLLFGILQRSAAHTFTDWINSKYKLKTGVTSVSHSFGEQKTYHPHAHMLVAWGGIHNENHQLIKINSSDFVNYKFLKKKFRHKFEDELFIAFDKKKMKHHFHTRKEFETFIKSINKKDWIIHLEKPVDNLLNLIKYIGRYIKRACISEYKITNIEGDYISFRYKDYKDRDANKKAKEKILTLHYYDFFPRLLQHVPEVGMQIVRHYGAYANRVKNAAQHLTVTRNTRVDNSNKGKTIICKSCNVEMIYSYTYIKHRQTKSRRDNQEEIHKYIRQNIYGKIKIA